MRTTLTIDEDVAVQIEELRRTRRVSLKAIVNEALRRGVRDLAAAPKPRKAFRTKAFDVGEIRAPDLDNIAEAVAWAEGEDHR